MLALAAVAALGGCVVKETRPLPQLQAVQAVNEVAAPRLLDVGIHIFDPGIPKEVLEDPERAAEERVYPEIRNAEARYIPNQLRDTLVGTAQWGAVRVVPSLVDSSDLTLDGRILESTGAEIKLAVRATDATGRVWLDREYEGEADKRAYGQGGNLGRDPFQNVYVNIANDLLEARKKFADEDLAAVQRVSELRFAAAFAPAAFGDYLEQDKKTGQYRAVRLPADNDPVYTRIVGIRERDEGLVDTVSDAYASFSERMDQPYDSWRRYTYDEIKSEEKIKAQARNRLALGALAVAAAIFVPSNSNSVDSQRIEGAARTAAAAGGVMAIMSGLKKRDEAKMHTESLKELSESFRDEAEPLVVEVEGRTLRLTGTAEEQYAEWRRLLHELYVEDTGLVTGPPLAEGSSPSAATGPG